MIQDLLGGGSYYLGYKMSLFSENGIDGLVNYISLKYGIKRIITLGSSKGGTCAILYGLRLGADLIISGSPQFYLGKYLSACGYHKKILKSIINLKKGFDSTFLDNIVYESIIHPKANPQIILLYSSSEGDYFNHIFPLIEALKKQSYRISLHDFGFLEHGEIGNVMKDFISKKLTDYV